MGIGGVKIFDRAITESKLDTTAAKVIKLAKGEKFEIKDNAGFTLLLVDNDTKEVRIRGNLEKI